MNLAVQMLTRELERVNAEIDMLNSDGGLWQKLFVIKDPLNLIEREEREFMLTMKKHQFEEALKKLQE